jgi:OmpR family response regulator RpaB
MADSEVEIQKGLELKFLRLGYDFVTASDGQEALSIYREQLPTIVILDILIPTLDGFGVCKEIRKHSDVPIIFLTSLRDLPDKITAFDYGADEYILKPFSFEELEARVEVILKRVKKSFPTVGLGTFDTLSIGRIRIDKNRRQVYKYDKRVRLTGMEFSLLELLISNSGKAFSRSSILRELWGYTPERDVDTRVVDVHVSRLRSKLEHDPSNPDLILTVRGAGYFFQGLRGF